MSGNPAETATPAQDDVTSLAGLSQGEAKQKFAQYGYNESPEKKRNPLLEFLSHFWGPIPRRIEAAAILSAPVKHWADFVIILLLLLPANAVVGFWEEFQAGNSIAALTWGYALVLFLANDRIKPAASRLFYPQQPVPTTKR